MRTKASILVGLLWSLALLSVVVIGLLHTARLDLVVVKNYGDLVQAHYLALAGIEKTKALLYQDAVNRRQSRLNHTGDLYDAPLQFRGVPFGRGQFRIFHRGTADEGGPTVYGITDEESRLNINVASAAELGKLYGMTPDIIAAIVDWRDADNEVTPGGAEADYYMSLQPPYLPRNGPLETVSELLLVRGVTRELLFGSQYRNGPLDVAGNGGPGPFSRNAPAGAAPGGWASILTVDSLVENVNAGGADRINLQSADENQLTSVRGITPNLAKAIVAYRGQHRLETLADLLDVTAVQNPNQPGVQPMPGGMPAAAAGSPVPPGSPPNNPSGTAPAGPKLISDDLFMDVADDLTAASEEELPGAVNLNTADPMVLACLPGIDPDLAQAIVSYRRSNGYFPNVAWLLKVPGLTHEIFKQVVPRVTVRSETFRILSEGRVDASGARQRIQAIVHVGRHRIDTLAYQEDP